MDALQLAPSVLFRVDRDAGRPVFDLLEQVPTGYLTISASCRIKSALQAGWRCHSRISSYHGLNAILGQSTPLPEKGVFLSSG